MSKEGCNVNYALSDMNKALFMMWLKIQCFSF